MRVLLAKRHSVLPCHVNHNHSHGFHVPAADSNLSYPLQHFDGLPFLRAARMRRSELASRSPTQCFDEFKPYPIQVTKQGREALRQRRDALVARIVQLETEKAGLAEHAARSTELEARCG